MDDEPTVRDVLAEYLEREGYRVDVAPDRHEARRGLTRHPDLVVLDVMMPGFDGLRLLAHLRQASDVPVILLTARSQEADRVVGLDLGADDYVTKPFSPRELVARVRSVLRRQERAAHQHRLEFEGLTIDAGAREVTVNGRAIETRPREFDLLAFLASFPRQVFSRAELLEQVWDSPAEYQDLSTVTVHVRRIRQKIETDPLRPRWIITVWGVGYRFEP